jgi:hypothetical protein
MNNITDFLNRSNTDEKDLDLFMSLTFFPFSTCSQEEFFVGKYKLPDSDVSEISVYVTCMPAQFWRFDITTEDGFKYMLTTGSGILSDYWEIALKVAEGMVAIERTNELPDGEFAISSKALQKPYGELGQNDDDCLMCTLKG